MVKKSPSPAFSFGGEIVYLGQIVSYLRGEREGAFTTPVVAFPKSWPSFFFSTFSTPSFSILVFAI